MDIKVIHIFGCVVKTQNILLSWIFLSVMTADFSKALKPTRSSMKSDHPSSFRRMNQKEKGHRFFTDRGYATRTPEILATKKNYTVKRGNLAILHCTVQNLGTKTVVWRRSSEENPLTVGEYTYVSDARFSTQHKVRLDQWNLHIRNVSLEDAGTYECQVSTKDRSIRRQFNLDVQDWARYHAAIKITGKKFVEKGEPIVLNCNATDYYAPHDIDWFKDGDKLDSDEIKGIEITKSLYLSRKTITSVLKIKKANMKDAGDYLCRTSERYITTIHVQVLNADTNTYVKRGTQSEFSRDANRGHISAPAMCVHLLLLTLILLFQT
ncbi:zwei Ig domain protein zig-8-like [Ylistrum balloti]|uniref:zwei Ig domain protein zig-8-like n=1 Tax=Ylistrum balloti TaxID=509963 RepID=UPI002905A190|nr:zwei Ig domain protein zig-8-like [Ylistrum balloti]